MEALIDIFKTYGTQLSALGAAIVFIFGVYKFQAERKASHFWKEFDAYHKLVKELVEPSENAGKMWLDRQTAVVYELRFYKRYFPHTLRMLNGLGKKWANENQFPRLIEEMDLTIKYINSKL